MSSSVRKLRSMLLLFLISRVFILAVSCFLLFLSTSCNSEKILPEQVDEGSSMIAEIVADPERHIGQVITVQGHFQDWQVGQCQFPDGIAFRAQTRSDWLLRIADDCIYVTGGIPSSVDPMNPEDIGRPIEIEAEIRKDSYQQIYLLFKGNR